MRECPKCRRHVDLGRDFCPCGEYLRWEPTGQAPVIAMAPPPLGQAAPQPRPAAQLAPSPTAAPPTPRPAATPLRSPAAPAVGVLLTVVSETGEWLPRPVVQVAPRGAARLTVRIRNQRGVVDHFSLRLEGMPAGWWTAPDTVHLLPYGNGGGYEQDVVLMIHPPRAPEAEARAWPVRIVATSHSTREDVAAVTATAVVERFDAIGADAAPERRSGRRRARYRITVHNAGNATADIIVSARDDGNGCRFRLRPARLELRPGEAADCSLIARPRRPILLGTAIERQIEALVEPATGGEPRVAQNLRFTQRPWLPAWLRWLVPLVVLAVAAFAYLHVRVPDVQGLLVDAARLELAANHLEFKPPQFKVSKEKVGTVLGTIPPADSSRLRGSEVTLVVATRDGVARVPDVTGDAYADAVMALTKAGFQVGGQAPGGHDAKVASQIPHAGRKWPRKRPVELGFASKPSRPDGQGDKVAVPAVAGSSEQAAERALEQAGLKPRVRYEISEEPAGTVIGTRPSGAAARKGDAVILRVSAGFPQIAYDDGRDVFIADGSNGGKRRQLDLAGDGRHTQASWTPDGLRIVYRSGSEDAGTIWISEPATDERGAPRGGRRLTTSGFDDRRAAVSPDGEVVAFVRGATRRAAHGLCFVRIARPLAERCMRDAGVGVSRPVWAPDGREIVARTDDGALLRFASTRPSAPSPSAWTSKGTVPIDRLGSIEYVAWSTRNELALAVTPPSAGAATLYVAADGGLAAPKPVPFPGTACELAWRPDGRQLVVAGRSGGEGGACPDAAGGDPGSATRLAPDGSGGAALGAGMVAPVFRPLELGG